MIPSRPRGLSMAVTLVTLLILSVLGLALGACGAQNLEQIQQTGRQAVLTDLHGLLVGAVAAGTRPVRPLLQDCWPSRKAA